MKKKVHKRELLAQKIVEQGGLIMAVNLEPYRTHFFPVELAAKASGVWDLVSDILKKRGKR